MINGQPVSTDYKHCYKCVSWSAVIAGAFIGVGLSFLLNLFSVAIGLTAYSTTQEGITAFAVGGFIGFAIGVVASMFVAGWATGYLSRPYCASSHLGSLYGFITWCLSLMLIVILSAPIGKFVASYTAYFTNHTVTVMNTEAPNAHQLTTTDKTAVIAKAVDVEKSANTAGQAGLALFALFFMGAAASCFGGHCGMVCRKDIDGCCKK